MEPIENDMTEIKVPSHLPNIKPETKAKGEAIPSRTIQIMLKILKKIKSKNIFVDLKLFSICWLFLKKFISTKSLKSKLKKITNIKVEKQMRYIEPYSNFNFKFIYVF